MKKKISMLMKFLRKISDSDHKSHRTLLKITLAQLLAFDESPAQRLEAQMQC